MSCILGALWNHLCWQHSVATFDGTRAIIMGHRDLSPDTDGDGHISPEEWTKQCPGFHAILEYEDLEPADLFCDRSDTMEM